MSRSVTIVVSIAALAVCAAYAARAVWINMKIATLSAPASTQYAEANAALPPKAARKRIVLIGDSRIARWSAVAWPQNWEIINHGIGNETAAQLALRFQADAIALDPDVIVIEAGINDLVAASFMDEAAMHAVADKTVATLQRLAGDGARSGHPTLVATIVPPARFGLLHWLVWKRELRGLVAEANADLSKSKLPERAALIDFTAPLVADDRNQVADEYRSDTLHFNEAGYARLTAALIGRVQSVLEAGRP
jgi:lysophospholipase L1-like esterase